ncbi:unnamed protein product [Symbiodinium necroappetens]|uniref:Uncharacterized protein n=1 Tax=Symbiodinium necroappetens TaxID=1628268 RepID=A0A812KJK2_9DINO|nr:unnamed protein product [Symbiodinium necroappetens]
MWQHGWRGGVCKLVLATLGGICLVWLVFLYADIFVVVSSDADVCPNGAELGGIETCNTSRWEGPCYAGTILEPCVCVKGFQPRITKMLFWSSHYHFRCCSEPIAGPVPTGDHMYVQVAGPLLLAMGIVGILVCSWLINRSNSPYGMPSQQEKAMEENPVQLDGAHLHSTVEMHRWSVTLADLHEFRRLVLQAIADGRIKPTDQDPFDAWDVVTGPSMYTVTEQYIKTVTKKAGNASWALMKHPAGMDCDLFITHAWSEGIFEFVDKVTNSWPSGATAAYVCFLSNPQNLDIGGLITSPSESPFAKALESSKQMLVVPNQRLSIYTRIWCVYEAFLAYRLEKPIRTSMAPVPHFWPRVLRNLFAGCAFHGIGFLLVGQLPPDSEDQTRVVELLSQAAGLVCLFVLVFLYKTNRHDRKILQAAIYVCGALCALYRITLCYRKGFKRSNNIVFMIVAVCLMAGLEMDRLLAISGNKQTAQLKAGFKGIQAANSSNVSDAKRIHKEIEDQGQQDMVNHAVQVLVDMNLFSKDLQEITKHTGPLGDISTWSRSILAVSLMWWVTNTNQIWIGRILQHDDKEMAHWLRWVVFVGAALEAVTFYLLFVFMPDHRKAFAERTQVLLLLPVVLTYSGLFSGPSYETFYVLFVNSVVVGLSAAGPARVAAIPRIGAPVVRALFGRSPFKAARMKSPESGECGESGVPSSGVVSVQGQTDDEEDLVEV